MEFGKLPNVDQVDFALPPNHPHNAAVLGTVPPAATPMVYIGATGYNMKEWVGKWYPAGCKEREFLRAYGKQFNTIEFNTTHYRIPDTATVQRWCEDTPDDFRFCPKVPQTLSHARDLGVGTTEWRVFVEQMRHFGDKMGCCFLQLPPYFEPKFLPVLARFLEKWPPYLPLAVEVRHDAFFDGSDNGFFELLEQHRAATVITDVAGRRDVCHARLTNSTAMIRFVGNGLHPTDYARADAWAQRIADWVAQGAAAVYFFSHQPDNILSPELAQYLEQHLKTRLPQLPLRGPAPIVPPALQGTLF